MAIKGGQVLHAMNQFVIDRIQTGGPGNLNIPQERIFELGNYQTVGIVRDVPDLTFTLDCLDVDTEIEGLLVGAVDPNADPLGTDGVTGTKYSLATNFPVDIISPMKSKQGLFDIVKGVAIPQLTLESVSYRYGLRENAGEQFQLRGDSIFYIPGTPKMETFTSTGGASYAFANTALLYSEQGQSLYALNVSVDGVRQTRGTHYNDTATGITFIAPYVPASGAKVRVVYGTATVDTTSYTQTVHQGISVKPAAIRGKDIQVYVGTSGATPAPFKWTDVQSVNVDWRLTLEDDFEFGNPRAVSRDATEPPAVTGSIEIKPMDHAALFDKLQRITGVPATDVIGPQSSVLVPLEIRLLNPDSGGTTAQPVGTVLKTIYVPDARFTIPGYEGRANQKLVPTLNFESDGGLLDVFKGRRFA